MTASENKSLPTFGFLTIQEHQQHGLFGGYLILNAHGRPLEFHCTSPVKANRAQEILYGPTIKPFLYGEQISLTLIEKAKVKPQVVCTDIDHVLAVREYVNIPVVLISSESQGNQQAAKSSKLVSFRLADHELAIRSTFSDDQQVASEAMRQIAEDTDLSEPFSRIREAIGEAQAPSKAA